MTIWLLKVDNRKGLSYEYLYQEKAQAEQDFKDILKQHEILHDWSLCNNCKFYDCENNLVISLQERVVK